MSTRHPLITLVATLLLLIGCSVGLRGLSVTADMRVFFSDDNPELKAFEEQEALFYQGDGVVLAVKGDVYRREGLQGIDELTTAALQLPYMLRVQSLTNYQRAWRDAEEGIFVEALFPDPTDMDDDELAISVERAKTEPAIQNRLVANNAAFIVATLQMPDDSSAAIPEVMKPLREAAKAFRANHPDFELFVTGAVPFNEQLSAVTINDVKRLMPLCLLVCLLLLGVMLRSISAVIVTSAVVLSSVVITMSIAGWLGVVLNTVTAAAPVMVMTLAVAHSVHLLDGYRVALAHGLTKLPAIGQALRYNIQPVALTCLTTAIGFLCLNFSDAPPFRQLGNIVALGVVVGGLLSFTLLPALLALLPLRTNNRANVAAAKQSAAMRRFGEFVVRRRWPLLAGTALLSAPLVWLAPQNEINDDFSRWFPAHNEVRAGMDFMRASTGGLQTLNYTLDSGEPRGVALPEFFTQVDTFSHWLRQQPQVAEVYGYTSLLKRMNEVLRGGDENYRLPESAAEARQFLTVYELSLPKGHSLNNILDLGKRRTQLTVVMRSSNNNELHALDEKAQQWLAKNAPAISSPGASGTAKIFAELGQRNIRSMLRGSLLALVLISLVMLIALRSVRIGLISLVPNLLPVALGFGVWKLLDGEINIALSVVMGLTLGIIVDDSVHFLSKYRRARLTLPPAEAVPAAFAQVGRALLVTTVVLTAGFAILAGSNFVPTANMGLLTAITIAVALAADYLLLPPLLILLGSDRTN